MCYMCRACVCMRVIMHTPSHTCIHIFSHFFTKIFDWGSKMFGRNSNIFVPIADMCPMCVCMHDILLSLVLPQYG